MILRVQVLPPFKVTIWARAQQNQQSDHAPVKTSTQSD